MLLAVWLPAAFAARARRASTPRVLRSATKLVCQPLWFIGVYLAVTALAPCMRTPARAARPPRTLAGLAAIAVAVDIVRFGAGIDALGYLNLLVRLAVRPAARLLLRRRLAGAHLAARASLRSPVGALGDARRC